MLGRQKSLDSFPGFLTRQPSSTNATTAVSNGDNNANTNTIPSGDANSNFADSNTVTMVPSSLSMDTSNPIAPTIMLQPPREYSMSPQKGLSVSTPSALEKVLETAALANNTTDGVTRSDSGVNIVDSALSLSMGGDPSIQEDMSIGIENAMLSSSSTVSAASFIVPSNQEPTMNQTTKSQTKPQLSYNELLEEAFRTSGKYALSLQEIYDAIKRNHVYYETADHGWQSSVRHNLSVNPSFKRKPRPFDQPGKGCLWEAVEQGLVDYLNGDRVNKRKGVDGEEEEVYEYGCEEEKDGQEETQQPRRKQQKTSHGTNEEWIQGPQSPQPRKAKKSNMIFRAPSSSTTVPTASSQFWGPHNEQYQHELAKAIYNPYKSLSHRSASALPFPLPPHAYKAVSVMYRNRPIIPNRFIIPYLISAKKSLEKMDYLSTVQNGGASRSAFDPSLFFPTSVAHVDDESFGNALEQNIQSFMQVNDLGFHHISQQPEEQQKKQGEQKPGNKDVLDMTTQEWAKLIKCNLLAIQEERRRAQEEAMLAARKAAEEAALAAQAEAMAVEKEQEVVVANDEMAVDA